MGGVRRTAPQHNAGIMVYKQTQTKPMRPNRYKVIKKTTMFNRMIALLAVLLPFMASAQRDFINEGAEIFIQKGAVLTIDGDFINGNSDSLLGNVKNDGVIEIGGNFENAPGAAFGIFDDNTSTDRAVKFVGSGTQAIKGDMGSGSFYNLVIDKANATDTVELQTPVKVDGSVIFGSNTTNSTFNPSVGNVNHNNKGLIKTYSPAGGEVTLTVTNGSTDAIAGFATPQLNSAATTGYILTQGTRNSAQGGLERNINTAASYAYPIATVENGYNAVVLNFTAVPGGDILVKGKFNDGTDNTDGSVGYIGSNGVQGADNEGYNKHFASNPCNGGAEQWFIMQDGVKDHGYWSFAAAGNDQDFKYVAEMFPASFTMEGTEEDAMRAVKYAAAYDANVSESTIDWGRDMEAVTNETDLLSYSKNMGCYAGDGIPGGEYTGFGHMALKMGNGGTALPVELIYVKADAKDNSSIVVSWATALEINNSGFGVQRSTDGKNFTTIGWVAGGNNSTTTLSYSYNDKDVTANTIYYYQLKQVDNDGASEMSQIVSAQIGGSNTTAPVVIGDIVPNPAVDYSRIAVSSAVAQDVTVAIYDMTGRIVSDNTQSVSAGTSNVIVDVTMLANGNYTTVIVANGKSFAKNLLVAKN